jgi:hypothetical protein
MDKKQFWRNVGPGGEVDVSCLMQAQNERRFSLRHPYQSGQRATFQDMY